MLYREKKTCGIISKRVWGGRNNSNTIWGIFIKLILNDE